MRARTPREVRAEGRCPAPWGGPVHSWEPGPARPFSVVTPPGTTPSRAGPTPFLAPGGRGKWWGVWCAGQAGGCEQWGQGWPSRWLEGPGPHRPGCCWAVGPWSSPPPMRPPASCPPQGDQMPAMKWLPHFPSSQAEFKARAPVSEASLTTVWSLFGISNLQAQKELPPLPNPGLPCAAHSLLLPSPLTSIPQRFLCAPRLGTAPSCPVPSHMPAGLCPQHTPDPHALLPPG